MKRVFRLFAITVLIIILTSCTAINQMPNEGQKTGEEEVRYKDGTFVGVGDKWQYGNEDATVVINDGKIRSINLRRLDTEGNEVDYDNWTGKEINGKLYPNLKKFRKDLADAMIEKQTYEVDAISGATVSSENWKLAVKRALEKAKK
ncbi:MAG: FMN-binding protein [Firmicutes bacterium]|nr:FMN-binding protein [Bacillota bacterium]